MLIVVIVFRMLSTIKLNNKLFVKRDKVYDVRFNRLLPTKLDSFKLTVSQVAPEKPLNISTCYFSILRHILEVNNAVSHQLPPPPNPLPQGAGGLLSQMHKPNGTLLHLIPVKSASSG